MARVALPGAVTVTNGGILKVLWTAGGKPASNVYAFTGTSGSPTTLAKAQNIAADLRSAFATTTYQVSAGANWAFLGVDLLDISDSDNAGFAATEAPLAGTSPNPALPFENAVCVTLRTAKRGPLFRGRSYIGGFATLQVTTTNEIQPSAMSVAMQWVTAVQAALSGESYALGILSRAYPADTAAGLAAKDASIEPVVSFLVRDAFWDSQRRRGLG